MDFERYENKLDSPKRPKQQSDYIEWRKAKDIYDTEDIRLMLQFKDDAFKELNLIDLPLWQRNRIWDLAYEHGHSSGYSEIWNELIDLAYLFKE
jgi:hypothetical protein